MIPDTVPPALERAVAAIIDKLPAHVSTGEREAFREGFLRLIAARLERHPEASRDAALQDVATLLEAIPRKLFKRGYLRNGRAPLRLASRRP